MGVLCAAGHVWTQAGTAPAANPAQRSTAQGSAHSSSAASFPGNLSGLGAFGAVGGGSGLLTPYLTAPHAPPPPLLPVPAAVAAGEQQQQQQQVALLPSCLLPPPVPGRTAAAGASISFLCIRKGMHVLMTYSSTLLLIQSCLPHTTVCMPAVTPPGHHTTAAPCYPRACLYMAALQMQQRQQQQRHQ
jgi:hypothetical protein